MSIMKWLGPGPPIAPLTIVPPAQPVRCPICQAIECIPVCNIKSYSIAHDGAVIEQQIGYRVACQGCPTIYSIAPRGVFRHHQQSSPLTPEMKAAPFGSEPPVNGEIPPGHQRPMPRERPRV